MNNNNININNNNEDALGIANADNPLNLEHAADAGAVPPANNNNNVEDEDDEEEAIDENAQRAENDGVIEGGVAGGSNTGVSALEAVGNDTRETLTISRSCDLVSRPEGEISPESL